MQAAFFLDPKEDCVVECIESCCSESSPPRSGQNFLPLLFVKSFIHLLFLCSFLEKNTFIMPIHAKKLKSSSLSFEKYLLKKSCVIAFHACSAHNTSNSKYIFPTLSSHIFLKNVAMYVCGSFLFYTATYDHNKDQYR